MSAQPDTEPLPTAELNPRGCLPTSPKSYFILCIAHRFIPLLPLSWTLLCPAKVAIVLLLFLDSSAALVL